MGYVLWYHKPKGSPLRTSPCITQVLADNSLKPHAFHSCKQSAGVDFAWRKEHVCVKNSGNPFKFSQKLHAIFCFLSSDTLQRQSALSTKHRKVLTFHSCPPLHHLITASLILKTSPPPQITPSQMRPLICTPVDFQLISKKSSAWNCVNAPKWVIFIFFVFLTFSTG